MAILSRIKRIISANINIMIEKAEEPEAMLKQLIREMDESIISLRNESIKALAMEKRFSHQNGDYFAFTKMGFERIQLFF